jgi:hypothetical protein
MVARVTERKARSKVWIGGNDSLKENDHTVKFMSLLFTTNFPKHLAIQSFVAFVWVLVCVWKAFLDSRKHSTLASVSQSKSKPKLNNYLP